jgi:hypothetical protein
VDSAYSLPSFTASQLAKSRQHLERVQRWLHAGQESVAASQVAIARSEIALAEIRAAEEQLGHLLIGQAG